LILIDHNYSPADFRQLIEALGPLGAVMPNNDGVSPSLDGVASLRGEFSIQAFLRHHVFGGRSLTHHFSLGYLPWFLLRGHIFRGPGEGQAAARRLDCRPRRLCPTERRLA